MFCPKCGKEVPDSTKFCPSCGEDLSLGKKVQDAANNAFQQTEKEMGSAFNEMRDSFNGTSSNGGRLKDDRGLLSYILLSIITCGIYSYYFIYKIAKDVNVACDGDGQNTSGLAAFILLSMITCGIYTWFWYYNLGNRLAANAPRYGMTFQENGTTILLWQIFGSFLCGIGPFVAMHILIKNTNQICNAYNRKHGL
ncbi:DUF4234 domain-containing protein [Eubacterium sp.]